MTAILDDIAARRLAGQPLTAADAEALAASYDIVTLGMIADELRRARHGRATTFVRVADVRLPLVEGEPVTVPPAAGEVRLVGRFAGIEAASATVRRAVTAAGDVPVTAFSLVDLEGAAGSPARLTAWLAALGDAGLAAVADAALDGLVTPAETLRAAAAAGLPIARLVIDAPLSGDPLAAVRLVTSLGDAVGCVLAFAPLPRRPAEPTTGYADVKGVALARILLDLPHVQVDWAIHGPKLAQVSLTFGADDVDNVSATDDMAEGRRRAPLEEIRRNIRAASLEPVERDGRFRVA
jgi:aminodeoxyfutalosine synthase